MTGDTPTLADVALAAPLSHMTRAKIPFGRYANIMRWNEAMHDIPAWRDAGKRLHRRMDEAAEAAGLSFAA